LTPRCLNTLIERDLESLISEVGIERKFLNKYQNFKNSVSVLPVTEKVNCETSQAFINVCV